MHHAALLELTRILVVLVGALGIIASLVHEDDTEPAVLASTVDTTGTLPAIDLPAPSSVAPSTTAPTTTTTTASTTTAAPPTTTPPTTAPPTTAPQTTAPPATAPAATAPPTTRGQAPAPALASCESELVGLMNGARSGQDLPALTVDGTILDVARSWTQRLVSTGELQHNPDFATQVFGARPEARTAAENVGRAAGSAASLHQAFMDSASHRANILDPGHSHAAIGCSADQRGQLWATVNFWG